MLKQQLSFSGPAPDRRDSGVFAVSIGPVAVLDVLAEAGTGVWSYVAGSSHVVASATVRQLFDSDHYALPAAPEGWLEKVHPADRGRVRNEVERLLREEGPFAFEVRITREGQKSVLIEVRGRSHHERGRFARASGTVRRVERLARTLLAEEEEEVPPGCVLRPANVGMIAAAVVDELQAMYPSRSIHLALSGYLDGQWDPDRLAEALAELVACALHGEGYGAIIVRAVGRGPDVHLTVEGAAMAGAGLAEARRIIRAHGGTLSEQLFADPGKTRLVAVLPRRAR